jgi:hypothetical protein
VVAAAEATLPLEVRVTAPMVSEFSRPSELNELVPSGNVSPYVLVRALAVIDKAFAETLFPSSAVTMFTEVAPVVDNTMFLEL